METILELKKITKQFPGVTALRDVDLSIRRGEVHALVGENGAGKSTLVKIITGVMRPSRGEVIYCGRPVAWNTPNESLREGIAAIYQEPAIFPDLNVAENIYMGHQPANPATRAIAWRRLYRDTDRLFDTLKAEIRGTDKIMALSIAERQLVEIAKALSVQARLVIMDEPTSALSISESEELFAIIRDLKARGVSILFISHRIEDIFKVADRVTALRDGAYVGTRETRDVDVGSLITMMVGRAVDDLFPRKDTRIGEELLRVEALGRTGKYRDVSFSLHAGEILGLYGLVGAGRTEVAKAIFGMDPAETGRIFVRGREVHPRTPQEAIDLGVAYVPENKDEEGIILNMDITSNVTLPILKRFVRNGLLDSRAETRVAQDFAKLLEIKAKGPEELVINLSGGNKQKVSLAKWLATRARILLFDEPTKGIDVGAKAAVHRFITELAGQSYAILMISSELPEVMGMSDNILVMHEGAIKAAFPRAEGTQEKILASAIADR